MGLTKNRVVFGVHSISPYRISDHLPYGTLKVLGGANLELTGESEDLYGGSSKFAYASEATQVSTQLTANVKSYPDFLMELFLGATVTTEAAEAAGEILGSANWKGTSVIHATTGIASVGLISADSADLKFGRYVIVAVGAAAVDVYAMSDIDFNRGNKGDYLTDGLKIAANQTITTGGVETNLPNYGIKLTGGSGTIALVTGDTAVFDVFPPHKGISLIDVGSATAQFPNFGAFMLAAKNGERQIFQIQAYNVAGSGMPLPLQERAFMVSDLTMKLLRDETLDRVFRITAIEEVS